MSSKTKKKTRRPWIVTFPDLRRDRIDARENVNLTT